MKKLVFALSPLFLAIVAVFILYKTLATMDDPGFVLIGLGGWSLETSVVIFTVTLVVTFIVFYALFRFLGWLVSFPGRVSQRRKNIKFNRSKDDLIAGLIDSAEGNWEKAEKTLIKHASHSGAPLIHYLTAARAAQSRGALAKRDEYLRQAATQAPGSDIIIGLTQAELHLSGNQFEQALQTLTRLHSINPTHATVLKLLHQAYKKAGNWEGLRSLLPSLNEHKVLMEAEVQLLEVEVFGMQLRQAAASGEVTAIQGVWAQVPEHIKNKPGVAAIYFAAMIDVGAGADCEEALATALSTRWNTTLLALYASIQSKDTAHQLVVAERWLPMHPNDALLMSIIGRLSLKQGDLLLAEQYLTRSVAQEPSVQTLRVLGDLLMAQGQTDKAAECYKQGLELVSSQVVSNIDLITE